MRAPVFSLILVLVARPAAAVWQAEGTSPALAEFAQRVEDGVGRDSVGGITVGVVSGDRLIWARGFGWADRERRVPADPETIYRTGSISKSFTAVLVAQLASEGRFDLDDPVVDYFPSLTRLRGTPERIRGVTFRRLASHTAGLVREPALEGAARGAIGGWEAKVLSSIPTTGFLADPGERYSYSNIGFGVLGLAASEAVGEPFMDLVRRRILAPLGMRRTAFVVTAAMEAHLATGYVLRRDGTIDASGPAREHAGRGYKVPNGGVYSDVEDLGRFVAAMTGAAPVEILPRTWRQRALESHTPEADGRGYGLGFFLRPTSSGLRTAGHSGAVAGYTAFLVFDPESTIGVILLRNYNGGSIDLGTEGTALLEALVEEARTR